MIKKQKFNLKLFNIWHLTHQHFNDNVKYYRICIKYFGVNKREYTLSLIHIQMCIRDRFKIKIDINNAITPPNLLGIDRKIAYANKKYHSG